MVALNAAQNTRVALQRAVHRLKFRERGDGVVRSVIVGAAAGGSVSSCGGLSEDSNRLGWRVAKAANDTLWCARIASCPAIATGRVGRHCRRCCGCRRVRRRMRGARPASIARTLWCAFTGRSGGKEGRC